VLVPPTVPAEPVTVPEPDAVAVPAPEGGCVTALGGGVVPATGGVPGSTIALDNVNGWLFTPPLTQPVNVIDCAALALPGCDDEPGGVCANTAVAQVNAIVQNR
jgi:hypothetical protein